MATKIAQSSSCSEPLTKPAQTLFNAVSSIKLRLVRLLIEGGIEVDIRNECQQTPLLAACSSLQESHFTGETRREVVKYLISAGANVNVQDNTGRTPLIYAVITQAHASIIFDLVSAGAQLWVGDANKKCAFDYALQRQDIDQVGVIVQAYKRCYSSTRGHRASFRKKLTGIFKPGKNMTTTPKRKLSGEKKMQTKNSHKRKEGVSGRASTHVHSLYSALQEMQTSVAPLLPSSDPTKSYTVSQAVSKDESSLCDLCKNNILWHSLSPEKRNDSMMSRESCSVVKPRTNQLLGLNYHGYDLSAFIYRRRSTGSVVTRREQQCSEAIMIKRKNDLGVTLEDLYSATEMNDGHFNSSSTESLSVKSPRTTNGATMDTQSSKSLSVPTEAGSRVRSASVSLPTRVENSKSAQHPATIGRAFSFSHDEDARSATLSRDHIPAYSVDYCSSQDENWDDVLVIPSLTHIDVTSRSHDMTHAPDREMTSPVIDDDGTARSPSRGSDVSGRSSTCTSPIPRIVFTDFMNERCVGHDE